MSIDSLRSGAIRICFDPSLNAYPNRCRILVGPDSCGGGDAPGQDWSGPFAAGSSGVLFSGVALSLESACSFTLDLPAADWSILCSATFGCGCFRSDQGSVYHHVHRVNLRYYRSYLSPIRRCNTTTRITRL